MEKGTPVVIEKLSDGFIVTEESAEHRPGYLNADSKIFATMIGLNKFLKEHFSND